MAEDPLALVNYYARVGYGHHILSTCSRYLQTEPHDRLLHFWKVYGMMITGSSTEAIASKLTIMKEQAELRLAALIAELHLFRGDKEKYQRLHFCLESEEKCASEKTLLLGATFAWHLGDRHNLQRAKRFTTRVLKAQPQCLQAKYLYGWILLATVTDIQQVDGLEVVEAAKEKFDEVLEIKRTNMDALLGKAACLELMAEYSSVIDELNQVIVSYPWFYPAVCEKGRVGMLMQDWDLMQEASQQILDRDPENIDGLRLKIHFLMCKENNMVAAVSDLGDLLKSIERKEPDNARLYLEFAQPIARLAGRRAPSVLNRTLALVEKSQKVAPDHGIYILEIADQLFLSGDYTAAISSYRLASQMDEARLEALCGVVQCLLVMDAVDDAEEQLNILNEPSGNSPHLAYLKAQLCWLKNKSYIACRDLLDRTVDLHLKTMRRRRDYRFFVELNPDRLLGVAQLYLTLHKYEPKCSQTALTKSKTALELVLSAAPGFINGHLMLAQTFVDLGDLEAAQETIQTVLSLDSSCASAYVLLAQIHLDQDEIVPAYQDLEQALRDDFTIRESLQYYILQAKILIQDREFEQALLVLESAICLPSIKPECSSKLAYYTTGCKVYMDVSNAERAMAYMLLAKVHVQMRNYPEATKTIDDAKALFAGTPEEVQILIASCDLLIERGDTETALALLHQVPCESIYFLQGRVAMADIYLKQHDRVRFVSCYSELAELFPNAKTHVILGDALMKVNEPIRAIKSYEAALKENPKDISVIRKIGKALINSHEYDRAIEHYEVALTNGTRSSRLLYVQHDLAELCLNHKHYIKAELVARDAIARLERMHDGPNKLLIKCLLLLFKAQSSQGKYTPASEAIVKLKGFLRQTVAAQREGYLTDFCFQFSQVCEQQKDSDNAIVFLNEALKCTPAYVPALLALSKIHLSRGEISECEVTCVALLRSDPSNTEGGKMLIRVLLQRELYDAAVSHLQQILQREANCYTVLAQFLSLLRRLGRLEETEFYIQQAEKASPSSYMDAGLCYCKGIQARYLNNTSEAIQLLNNARVDAEWGKVAVYGMLEIYLNIDDELLCDEEPFDASTSVNGENISIAQQLLAESRYLDEKALAWECYVQMASRQKADVEMALSRLNEAAGKEKDQIFVMLCIAAALVILKQIGKAKAQLRSIDRLTYKWEEGDNFERTWLMLANIHIQAGKLDVAEQLCKKCLKYNKSSSKAWEWLGLIMEKGHAYNEAAKFYENAWKYQRESSPSIGYKLASVYLKSKRYIDAILICHKVLRTFPDNARIRKDVLDKARKSLRP